MKSESTHTKNGGFILPSVLIILVSLTLIAVTVAYRNTVDEMMAANQRDAINAMTVAESGEAAAFQVLKKAMTDTDAEAVFFDPPIVCDDPADEDLTLTGLVAPILQPDGTDDSVIIYDDRLPPATYVTSRGVYCYDDADPPIRITGTRTDFDHENDKWVINAVGSVNGAEREVETLYTYETFDSEHAILTEDDLQLRGESDVRDDFAFVHSNSNIVVAGQPTVDQTVSASGSVTLEGADSELLGTPATAVGAANEEIPYVNPLEFKDMATVILTWDCKVTDAAGTVIATANTNTKYRGWNCDSASNLWIMGTASGGQNPLGPLSAFYYVEGNARVGSSSSNHTAFASSCESHDRVTVSGDLVSGSPAVSDLTDDELRYLVPGMTASSAAVPSGTKISYFDFHNNIIYHDRNSTAAVNDASLTYTATASYCWKVSIVAEGNIEIGGDFDMQPYTTPILFISGNDISLKGQAAQLLDGLVAAHQEIEFAGQMNMHGSLIAENGKWAAGPQVTTNRKITSLVSANVVSGSGQLRKSGISETPFSRLIQDAWRELVDN